MATRGKNCNDWPRTVMTGGCLLVAFASDGARGNVMTSVSHVWFTAELNEYIDS